MNLNTHKFLAELGDIYTDSYPYTYCPWSHETKETEFHDIKEKKLSKNLAKKKLIFFYNFQTSLTKKTDHDQRALEFRRFAKIE